MNEKMSAEAIATELTRALISSKHAAFANVPDRAATEVAAAFKTIYAAVKGSVPPNYGQ